MTLIAHVQRVSEDNAAALLSGVDLVIDAVDNFRAKFALNRACMATRTPLIYAALSGCLGVTMMIVPGETACLACLYPEEPDAASSETAANAGAIPPIVLAIAGLQCAQALK